MQLQMVLPAEPPMDVAGFLEAYGACGGGHHLYLAEGDIREECGYMAKMLGWELNDITTQ